MESIDMKKIMVFLGSLSVMTVVQADPKIEALEKLDTIYVNAGHESQDYTYSDAYSSVYISGDKIGRFSPISTGDILKAQPGVQVGDNRNGGALDVNIRGIQGQSRVPVTVDGTEQALNVYRGYGGTQQRSYINPDLISSVRITKGAGHVLGGGVGGTVAIRTLDVQDIIPQGKQWGVRLTGQMWDNGITPNIPVLDRPNGESIKVVARKTRKNILTSAAKSGTIAFGYQHDKFSLVVAYARRNQGNYFAGSRGYRKYQRFISNPNEKVCIKENLEKTKCLEEAPVVREEDSVAKMFKPHEEVLNSAAKTQSFLLKATIRPVDEHILGLGYNLYDSQQTEIMPSDIYRNQNDGGVITQYPYGKVQIHRVNVNYVYAPKNNPFVRFKTNAWYSRALTSQLNAVETPKSQSYVTDRGWVKSDNHRFGVNISNTSDIALPNEKGFVSVKVGSSFDFEMIKPQAGVNIEEVDYEANRSYRHARRYQFDAYGHLSYEPSDQLKVWAGLRYENYQVKDLNRRAIPRREARTFKRLFIMSKDCVTSESCPRGYLIWYADKRGHYTDQNDPRKHNGIVHQDQNFPTDGIPYDEFMKKHHDKEFTFKEMEEHYQEKVVVGFDFEKNRVHKNHDLGFSVGAQYNFTPNTFVYVSYVQGTRMPSLFETTMGTTQVVIENNIELKPETTKNWELGLSMHKQGIFKDKDSGGLKIVYFNNTIDNYITRYFTLFKNGVMRFENADSFKVDGVELQMKYDSDKFFSDMSSTYYFRTKTCDRSFAESLRQTGFDSFVNTPDCTDGSFMGSYLNTQNPPKFSLNLTAGVRLFKKALTIGARLSHTSAPTVKIDKPWQVGPTTWQIYYQPITTVDLFAKYKFLKNGELNASVQNLMDQYYIDPLAQSYMPAPGRTFKLGFKYAF